MEPLNLGPGYQLVNKEVVLNIFTNLRAQLKTNLRHLLTYALLLQEMNLQLLPTGDFVVILFYLLKQLQTIEVVLVYVLLVDVDEVNLYGEASPLAILEYLDHVVDVVHQASCDDCCLIKHLREFDCSFTGQKGLFLLLSDVDGEGFEEKRKRLQLDGQVQSDLLQTFVVLFVQHLWLIRYEWRCEAEAHWE